MGEQLQWEPEGQIQLHLFHFPTSLRLSPRTKHTRGNVHLVGTISPTEIDVPTTITLQNGQTFNAGSGTSKAIDLLPVIDVSGMYSDYYAERKTLAEEIRAAAHGMVSFMPSTM